MNRHHEPQAHHLGRTLFFVIGLLVVGGVFALWGWNSIAVDLFHAPRARFVHGLAFELFLGASVLLCVYFARLVRLDRRQTSE